MTELEPNPCAPFKLDDALDTQWKDVRLSFSDWKWLDATHGTDTVDRYYLNGYGVQGLVAAVMFTNGIDPRDPTIHFNSEGDTCYIHFKSLDVAVRAAELAAAIAREQGFEE